MPYVMEELDGNSDQLYDNSHRAFLQAFLARGAMTFDEAKPILAAAISAQGGLVFKGKRRCSAD